MPLPGVPASDVTLPGPKIGEHGSTIGNASGYRMQSAADPRVVTQSDYKLNDYLKK
jgi:hypothetical protein